MVSADSAHPEEGEGQVGYSRTLPPVIGSPLGKVAAGAMAVSGVLQLTGSVLCTLGAMLALGSVSYLMLSYGGGLWTSGEEVALTAAAGVVILLASLIPFFSALAALYVPVALVRGGLAGRVYAACAVSVLGPLFGIGVAVLAGVASPPVAAIAAVVYVGLSLFSLVSAALAMWVVRQT